MSRDLLLDKVLSDIIEPITPGGNVILLGNLIVSETLYVSNIAGNSPVTCNDDLIVLGTLTISGALGPTSGGTGQSSWTTGDILYASGTNTLSKLPAASNGQVLTLSAGVPAWINPSSGVQTYVWEQQVFRSSSPSSLLYAYMPNSQNYGTAAITIGSPDIQVFQFTSTGTYWIEGVVTNLKIQVATGQFAIFLAVETPLGAGPVTDANTGNRQYISFLDPPVMSTMPFAMKYTCTDTANGYRLQFQHLNVGTFSYSSLHFNVKKIA